FRTISEVAKDLDLPQHVLRFWETRFAQIKPMKRGGGRRYYRPDDVDLLRGIKLLLYGEGYTIRGVQRILKEQGPRSVIDAGQAGPGGGGLAPEAADELIADYPPEAESAPAAVQPSPEPRRGRSKPAPEARTPPVQPADPGSSAGLAPSDMALLESTLADLLECKRLLDQAR
ncbi:MAG: MerR family transcriptional regulator, partial [Hyphomicrobiales bacterium]|nr:MerR family transcriptional regulator [Hyphomicrobiales bacterium]